MELNFKLPLSTTCLLRCTHKSFSSQFMLQQGSCYSKHTNVSSIIAHFFFKYVEEQQHISQHLANINLLVSHVSSRATTMCDPISFCDINFNVRDLIKSKAVSVSVEVRAKFNYLGQGNLINIQFTSTENYFSILYTVYVKYKSSNEI